MTRGKALPSFPRRWPTRWLMTDERMGDRLLGAIARLPHGSGVVLRHYDRSAHERERLARQVARICRRRALVLAVAGDALIARRVGAALVHNPRGPTGLLPFSVTLHDEDDARAAATSRPALAFVSPVFPTRSHPGAPALGPARAAALARIGRTKAIALGGMDEARFAQMRAMGFSGYAGIDCWLSD